MPDLESDLRVTLRAAAEEVSTPDHIPGHVTSSLRTHKVIRRGSVAVVMTLLMLPVLLIATNARTPTESHTVVAGSGSMRDPHEIVGTWRLVGDSGDEPVRVSFSADGDFKAFDGCNVLSARFHLRDDELTFDTIESTLKRCSSILTPSQTFFLDLVQKGGVVRSEGNTMQLRAFSDGSVTFARTG